MGIYNGGVFFYSYFDESTKYGYIIPHNKAIYELEYHECIESVLNNHNNSSGKVMYRMYVFDTTRITSFEYPDTSTLIEAYKDKILKVIDIRDTNIDRLYETNFTVCYP